MWVQTSACKDEVFYTETYAPKLGKAVGGCVALKYKYIFGGTTEWLGRKRTYPIVQSHCFLVWSCWIVSYSSAKYSTALQAYMYLTCLLCNKALWSVDCAVYCIIRTFRTVTTCSCNVPIFIRNPLIDQTEAIRLETTNQNRFFKFLIDCSGERNGVKARPLLLVERQSNLMCALGPTGPGLNLLPAGSWHRPFAWWMVGHEAEI